MEINKTIELLAGTFLVLILATIGVFVLRRMKDPNLDPAVIETFRSRVRAWWLLFCPLVGAFFLGPTATVSLFAMISLLAFREYITVVPTRLADHRSLFWVYLFCIPAQFLLVGLDPHWFRARFGISPYLVFSILIPAYVFLLVPAWIAASNDPKRFLERIAKIQVGLLICVYCLGFVPALLTMEVPARQTEEAVGSPVLPQLLDSAVEAANYAAIAIETVPAVVLPETCQAGKTTKNLPESSPGSSESMRDDPVPDDPAPERHTVHYPGTPASSGAPPGQTGENVANERRDMVEKPLPKPSWRKLRLLFFFVLIVQISDLLQYAWSQSSRKHVVAPTINSTRTWSGVFGGAATTALIGIALWYFTPFTRWWEPGVVAFAVSLMGFAGGITMSAIKRDRGVEDYGTLVEGHGGILDRLDSLCFAAPLFYHLTWLFLNKT